MPYLDFYPIFLVIGDKLILYIRTAARMGSIVDSIGFVDENGDEGYDVSDGDYRDIVEKYNNQLKNVKEFKELKRPRSKMKK